VVSPAVIERLGSVYENYGRGEFFLDTDLWHPEVGFVFTDEFPDPGTYRGIDRLTEAFTGWLRAWDRWQVELQGFETAPDGRLVAWVVFRGYGRGSGLAVETEGAHVWSFDDDGLVTRLEIHASRAVAKGIVT
jgi:ketosteroid isomerase-like protein